METRRTFTSNLLGTFVCRTKSKVIWCSVLWVAAAAFNLLAFVIDSWNIRISAYNLANRGRLGRRYSGWKVWDLPTALFACLRTSKTPEMSTEITRERRKAILTVVDEEYAPVGVDALLPSLGQGAEVVLGRPSLTRHRAGSSGARINPGGFPFVMIDEEHPPVRRYLHAPARRQADLIAVHGLRIVGRGALIVGTLQRHLGRALSAVRDVAVVRMLWTIRSR